ncbi:MAG: type I restriction enzyme HsdR N-terminal domain-containing protein [Bryobacteraceae bacterium]|nr:type I restriction enzyme HsdR N-terminal domain-containing protein [Bryobacteraceae bacterium]
MFSDFDFAALDDPRFNEDAVREEIIAPVIKRAGFRPTGGLRVQRGMPLTHPYVMIGSKRHPVSIIPDYALFHDDKPLMILDAKAPAEKIVHSKHVEQAYSYAIHPEVRCQIYGLCNGRQWSFFHVGRGEPLLVIETEAIDARWADVETFFDPKILSTPEILDFDPDFGLHAWRTGVDQETLILFEDYHLQLLMPIDGTTWTVSSTASVNEREHLISFDLDEKALSILLQPLPGSDQRKVRDALQRSPFQVDLAAKVAIDCRARLEHPVVGAHERFAPFRIIELISSRYDPTSVRTQRADGLPSGTPEWIVRL